MKKYFFLFVIVLLFQSTQNLLAQTYGKIISKEEADSLFGEILESKPVTVSDFMLILEKSNSYLMFLLEDGELVIKKEGQEIVYKSGTNELIGGIFHVFSKSIIMELLSRGQSEFVLIDRREKELCISYENYILEFGMECPPFCL